MKKIKKLKPNGFYLFRGKSSADSSFIENVKEAKQFMIYSNYFLKDYLKVYDYVINQDGWEMIVGIRSRKELLKLLKESDEAFSEIEFWRLISEQMRKCLSSYVLNINRRRGRTGSLVHSSYERYYFETLHEARHEIMKIRNQLIDIGQRNKRYRGKKSHYKVTGHLGVGSIFMCSGSVRDRTGIGNRKGGGRKGKEDLKRLKKVGELLESFVLGGLTELVLSNLVKQDKKEQQSSNSPPKTQFPY